ncbi:MAG: TylF/MycF/NovP-related O-methyltransferase [Alphaproteobacteria bacterium]|jgi:predicted O-methyltransferase YrrM
MKEDTKPDPNEDALWNAWHGFHYDCDTARIQKVLARHYLFLDVRDLPGHIVDAGVFKGASTLLFAHMLKIYAPHSRRKVIGFDTFTETFEDAQEFESGRAAEFMEHYAPDMKSKLEGIIAAQGLTDQCELVAGDISQTLPQYVEDSRGMRISLLHLDLDVREPTLAALRASYDLMTPGGLIVLDEYGVEGWGESDAVDTFFRERGIRPKIESVPFATTPTAMIRVP